MKLLLSLATVFALSSPAFAMSKDEYQARANEIRCQTDVAFGKAFANYSAAIDQAFSNYLSALASIKGVGDQSANEMNAKSRSLYLAYIDETENLKSQYRSATSLIQGAYYSSMDQLCVQYSGKTCNWK